MTALQLLHRLDDLRFAVFALRHRSPSPLYEIIFSSKSSVQIAEFYIWAGTAGKGQTNSGLNIRTVLHIHRLLRQALQQAVLWQLRPTNPADLVDAPRPPEIEMRAVEEDRAGSFILLSEGTRLFLPILTALAPGCAGVKFSAYGGVT